MTLIEGHDHPNLHQNAELSGLCYHTQFDRNQSVKPEKPTLVFVLFCLFCFIIFFKDITSVGFSPLHINRPR